MKKYEEEEMTNLVWTNLETIAHSSHSRRSKNSSKRWKIQTLEENGKMKFGPISIFDRFIFYIYPYYKVIFWVFNHFFEELLICP